MFYYVWFQRRRHKSATDDLNTILRKKEKAKGARKSLYRASAKELKQSIKRTEFGKKC